tara:strand:- start:5248 stop:5493 length:246 start_codon:yes stop_codon:yes gene_type:complete
MSLAVEKNIPVPPLPQPKRLYPFPDMEVGDSFFCPAKVEDALLVVTRIRTASRAFRARHGATTKKFKIRRVAKGVRCWRTA